MLSLPVRTQPPQYSNNKNIKCIQNRFRISNRGTYCDVKYIHCLLCCIICVMFAYHVLCKFGALCVSRYCSDMFLKRARNFLPVFSTYFNGQLLISVGILHFPGICDCGPRLFLFVVCCVLCFGLCFILCLYVG
jgi:hypothetical protein